MPKTLLLGHSCGDLKTKPLNNNPPLTSISYNNKGRRNQSRGTKETSFMKKRIRVSTVYKGGRLLLTIRTNRSCMMFYRGISHQLRSRILCRTAGLLRENCSTQGLRRKYIMIGRNQDSRGINL